MNIINPAGPRSPSADAGALSTDRPAASRRAIAGNGPAGASVAPNSADGDDRASLQSLPGVGRAEPFDEGRVNLLRTQIASGQYHVDARATAAAMLSQMLGFHGIV